MGSPSGRVRSERRAAPRGVRLSSFCAPFLFVAGLLLLGLYGLEKRASAQGFGWIEPATLDFDFLPEWADPRWKDELRDVAALFPPLRTDDPQGLEAFRAAIEELSFVRSVGPIEVLWPDGLRFDLQLYEPIACVPLERGYQLVSDDGTLLSGVWSVPPRVGGRWLPVIGPIEDARRLFSRALPGDYLFEREHTDALDVALSMRLHLTEAEQRSLGRTLIDARRARETSVVEPGVRLDLEGARRVLFGRAPFSGEPGELEDAAKWRSVVRALGLLEDGSLDWDLLDVRWDRPDLAPRGGWPEPEVPEADAGATSVAGPSARPRTGSTLGVR